MSTRRFFGIAFFCSLLAMIYLSVAGAVFGQNTGGVFGPGVEEDHRQSEYRVTFDPDSDGLAQRFHYEGSLNSRWMLRGVVQSRKTIDSDFDFDYIQGEAFLELSEDDAKWRTGFRFDLRFRDGDRSEVFGINWMNQWALPHRLTARFLVLTSVELGDNPRDGIFLQTRGALYHRTRENLSLGFELYNSYGSTDNIPDFEDQRHQFGPSGRFYLGRGVSLTTSALFGLTDATPDAELRLWLTFRH